MNVSHPAVHPIEAPPLTDAANGAPRARMKDIQGMPGTLGGLVLRFFQFAFAAVSLCVMATTSDFPSVTAFCYLVAAVSLQSVWSLSLAIVDIYALLVRRCLRNSRIVSLFTVGDGVREYLHGILTKLSSYINNVDMSWVLAGFCYVVTSCRQVRR
ncbi:hypothetical protein PVL29_016867 [Vitis rotundifolia]|uniref:CASP-like protein n=1 Tax=Vitis rotundifolia TaxID=103349 RepID=A0AA39DIA4_VITRO|nr:hypothetical protein PVL29_016867 [Vitis rotundifolia]